MIAHPPENMQTCSLPHTHSARHIVVSLLCLLSSRVFPWYFFPSVLLSNVDGRKSLGWTHNPRMHRGCAHVARNPKWRFTVQVSVAHISACLAGITNGFPVVNLKHCRIACIYNMKLVVGVIKNTKSFSNLMTVSMAASIWIERRNWAFSCSSPSAATFLNQSLLVGAKHHPKSRQRCWKKCLIWLATNWHA